MTEETTNAHSSHTGRKLVLGLSALAGSIIVAPYLLPILGVGSEELAEEVLTSLCGTGDASGLAGTINEGLAQIPVVGASLAEGGWASAGAVATIGVGGHFLANHVEEKEKEKASDSFPWSRAIRYASLTTSMLVALPSILTGLSAGIVYLAAMAGGAEAASTALTHLSETLGTSGSTKALTTGVTGVAVTVPHLLTCGLSLFPATLPWLLGKGDKSKKQERAPITLSELRLEAATSQPLRAGESTTLTLRLSDAMSATPIPPEALMLMHEKKLHVFAVDGSLGEYHHLHPEPTSKPGMYAVSFTPAGPGPYRIWAEATPESTGKTQTLQTNLPAEAIAVPPRLDFRPNRLANRDNLQFSWSASPPLRKGEGSLVTVQVTDKQGAPVLLDPLLGASAHLVGFSGDGKHCLHTHPLGGPDGIPPLRFHISAEHDGPTRFFLQVKYQGQEFTTSFDQNIFPAKAQAYDFATALQRDSMQTGIAHGRI